MNSIYPVILSLPEKLICLKGRKKVLSLSRYARIALAISAEKSSILFDTIAKDEKGVPLPSDGKHWSITHKPEFVGGVAAHTRIGIDIEKIKVCSGALFEKTASASEWALSNEEKYKLFFRYWTAKEAVLKAETTGIKGLLRCRVIRIIDENNLIINYKNTNWVIEHFFFKGHIASIVKNSFIVKWILMPASIIESAMPCCAFVEHS